MNTHFIESKQPTFFSFNRIIQNHETEIGYDLFIANLENNFEKDQQEHWYKFWNKQGEEQVLQAWNYKYKDYLKDEQDSGIEKNTDSKIENGIEFLETQAHKEREVDKVLVEKSWEDLWQEHREEIYCELYLTFTIIYYNYYLDLKKACENPQPISENNHEIDDKNQEDAELREEIEKLSLLGLPTSFGGRKQNSNINHKASKKSIINYSDFFSDSEMESESNGSDIEDCTNELNLQDCHNLHHIKTNAKNKVQKRKRNRKLKNVPSFILEEKGLLKYWRKRFSLFSRFDEGIRLDRESWFSVTPEKVAEHLAQRLKCDIVVDGFCGSGGNMIQFALTCKKVIAIDVDPVKLEMAKHNANIYKVSHKIDFILGDFLQMAKSGNLKADVVFLSPPWGGPKYKNKKEFDIEKYLLPVKASELLEASRNISQNIALFLPRNSSVKQIVKLAGVGNRCEIEHNYLDSRLVAITALYGEEILTKDAAN